MVEMLPIEEPDPFDELTGGEIAAFIYKKCGEDDLRQLLAVIGTRESVEEVADELSAAGLRKAARITAEVAATKPPMTDMVFCDYEPGSLTRISAGSGPSSGDSASGSASVPLVSQGLTALGLNSLNQSQSHPQSQISARSVNDGGAKVIELTPNE